MIYVCVVVTRPELQSGIDQLLEADGDISVRTVVSSLEEFRSLRIRENTVVVVGPEIARQAYEQNTQNGLGGGHPTVALVSIPFGYHAGFLEVPLELRGDHLRNAVRLAAMSPAIGTTTETV